jgi:hypothetical protein
MRRALPAVLLAAALAGCATAPKPAPEKVPMTPAPPPGLSGTSPMTQVVWKDLTGVNPARRAAYDENHVTGPYVSLTRADATHWKGTLRGQPVELTAVTGRVSGPGTDLSFTFGEKNAVVVEGFWAAKPVNLVLGTTKITATLAGGVVELSDMGTGMFNSYQGLLEIAGPPDMPQTALAILSVLVP